MKASTFNPLFPRHEKWWLRSLNIVSLSFSFILFLAFLAPYVPPSYFTWIAILGLGMPYLFWVNLTLIVFLSFFYWKKQGYFFLLLIFGFNQISNYYSFFPLSDKMDGKAVKVMTYNVHVFDMYSGKKGHQKRKKIISFFHRENPDILVLQESYKSDIPHFYNTKDTISLLNSYTHFAEDYLYKTNHQQYFGAIIFSRYPIIRQGTIPFPGESYNRCLWADIVIAEDTLRFYNMHLGSIRLQKSDYEMLGDKQGVEKYYPNAKSQSGILGRLALAFKKREEQSLLVKNHAEKSPYPTILAGDINDTPNSYSYGTLSGGLKDAHLYNRFGSGGTYQGQLPNFRIDYIFYPQNFGSTNYQIHQNNYSDHYAVSMDLILPN